MLKKAFKKAEQDYILRQDISGVAIGKKFVKGKKTDEDCITIYVPVKKPSSQIPKDKLIEKEIEGVRTDVIEAKFKAHGGVQSYNDPMRPGISIGPSQGSGGAGTLGCFVYNASGALCFLTNWHVVHGPATFEYILQPGRLDGGKAYLDTVGITKDYYIDSTGDAAIVEFDTMCGREISELVYQADQRLLAIGEPEIGDLVEKCGRTTGVTYGEVSAFGTFSVDYSDHGLGTLNVSGHSIYPRDDAAPGYAVSLSGDSGSVWYNATTNTITGLNFAGTDLGDYAVACSIVTAFDTLGISLNKKRAKIGDGQNLLTLPWFVESSSQTMSADIVFPGDFSNVYCFTEEDYFGVVFARLSGETTWMEVGTQSLNPSCLFGNFANSQKITVEFKIEPGDLISTGEHTIPIWFSYGDEVSGGGL